MNAQTAPYKQVIVKSITPTKWTVRIPYVETTTTNNKGKGAVIGGAVGYLVKGGFWGTAAGALIGSQVADNPQYITETKYKIEEFNGYIIQLNDGTSYRTTKVYNTGQIIDPKTIQQE